MNKITFPLKPGMQGPAVADLQEALQVCLDRGAIMANDAAARQQLSAQLKPERDAQTYGEGTRAVVSVFQRERGLADPAVGPSGEVDEPTANALNALLKDWGLLDQPTEPPALQSFVVSGQVRGEDGRPVRGAMVMAVDRDLRSEEVLGQATTSTDGRYEIRYTSDQFARAEKGGADLVVRALSAAGAVLAESPTLFNAPREATVDLVLSQTAAGLPSEFERVVNEVEPLLTNVTVPGLPAVSLVDKLADLKPDEIDFVASETGVQRQKVEFLVL